MNWIDKKHGVNNNYYNNKQHNCHKRTKHQSMKDLLPCILVTAPMFHAEMFELKAELRNTAQTTAGRTNSGGREEAVRNSINEKNKLSTNNNYNNKQNNCHKRSITRWKTHCFSYWSRPPCSMPRCPNWRLYWSRTLHKQYQVKQQVEGGGDDEFNK